MNPEKTKKARLVSHTTGTRTRGPIDERVSKALKGEEEPWEVYKAAQSAIDEYRHQFMKAVELVIKQAEVSPGQWSFVETLFLNLLVDPLGSKVAIEDATYAKLLNAGFRVFGCSICGSRRWRSNTTRCKPCLQRLEKGLAAKGPNLRGGEPVNRGRAPARLFSDEIESGLGHLDDRGK